MAERTGDEDLQLVEAALRRERAAARQLVGRLRPIIQARVARVLARHGRPGQRRNQREEVADLAQDVFRVLFDRDGRVLRTWSPDRGASLENFVGLVAQRHALSVVRTKRGSPWTEDPTDDLDLDRMLPDVAGPEAAVATRELLDRIVGELRDELSPKGLEIFELLIVDEEPVAEVQERLGMSRDAVYAWRSRLGKVVRQKLSALLSDPAAEARMSDPEGP